ncbi:hypothetical protein TRVL_09838 [Trypanosoma vivax]|nr:hypothetical protein TRVL_09838 [Trypanosoma vivax]
MCERAHRALSSCVRRLVLTLPLQLRAFASAPRRLCPLVSPSTALAADLAAAITATLVASADGHPRDGLESSAQLSALLRPAPPPAYPTLAPPPRHRPCRACASPARKRHARCLPCLPCNDRRVEREGACIRVPRSNAGARHASHPAALLDKRCGTREQRPPSPAHMRIVSRALRQCVLDSAAPPAPPVHCTTGPCACWFLCRPVSDLFAERRPSPAQRRCLADRLRPDRAARRGERTTAKQLSVRCAPRQLAGMAPVRAGLARAAVEGAEGNWPAGLPGGH